MTINQRFTKIISDLYNGNKRAFSTSVGISPTVIENIVGARQGNPSFEVIQKVLSTHLSINADWLILENGDPYAKENTSLILSEETPAYNKKVIQIPIMDVSVAAGITGHINENNFDTLDHIILPKNMVKKSATYVCVRTRGESMSPTILDSDNIVIRLLDASEWSTMPDEHVYVIVDKEGKSYLKRVKNRINNGFIVCMSDNIEKSNYPNFNLQTDEIASIWHAEWHISAKMPNINENYYSRLKQLEDQFDILSQHIKLLNIKQ